MKLQVVGLSHHQSDVETRQQLAFGTGEIDRALDTLRVRFPENEAVLLSTCNRVEVYMASEDVAQEPTHKDLVDFLADFHGLDSFDIFDSLFERTGEDAVRHLFFVAASLDSMVVGEAQILSQVKQAYESSTRAGNAGPVTHAVFQAALKVARRVATETAINQRRTSIPSVAVSDFASQIFERFDDKEILVIGAGEMGGESLRYLRDAGAKRITVINRDPAKAQALAQEHEGLAAKWDDLSELLIKADLIVTTTGASEPIVTLEQFKGIESARYQRPLAILDLAVPRDFDPEIGDCLGVYLYSIDDLSEACERNRQARQKEWPAAEKIVEDETTRFMSEWSHRATAPTIKRLKESFADLQTEELRRLYNKLPNLDDKSREEIGRSVDRLVNKMLHPPLESLRSGAGEDTSHSLLDAFKRLFQLKD